LENYLKSVNELKNLTNWLEEIKEYLFNLIS